MTDSKRAARSLWLWSAVGVVVLGLSRLTIAFTAGSGVAGDGWITLLDIVLVMVVVAAILVWPILVLARRSRRLGIHALRAQHPDADVAAVAIMAAQLENLDAVASTRFRFQSFPLVGRAVLTRTGIDIWRGVLWPRRLRIVAREIRYSVGNLDLPRSSPAALVATIQRATGETVSLPMLLYPDSERWFVAPLAGNGLSAMADRLNAEPQGAHTDA